MPPALRHRNLPQLLLESREALMGHFRPLLNAQGVTDQQWRILRTLLLEGPLEPHQLCVRCALSSPSLTGVLQRMEEAGWIRRERMAEDGRRLKVSVTARSRRLGGRLLPAIEARYAQLEAALGVARLQQVYDDLDALMASLGALAAPGEAAVPGVAVARAPRAAARATALR
jgi:homoprotocatechuate degradation regulator HpaR